MKDKKTESFVNEPQAVYTTETVSIHDAKTNFSKLIKRAEAGETIYIGAYGKPTVALTAVNQRAINAKLRAQACGCMKGKIEYKEGWDHWTDEELYEMFYASFMTWEEFKKS